MDFKCSRIINLALLFIQLAAKLLMLNLAVLHIQYGELILMDGVPRHASGCSCLQSPKIVVVIKCCQFRPCNHILI